MHSFGPDGTVTVGEANFSLAWHNPACFSIDIEWGSLTPEVRTAFTRQLARHNPPPAWVADHRVCKEEESP